MSPWDSTGRSKPCVKVAPSGDFTSLDRLAGQDVLFGSNVNAGPLRAELFHHFRGRAVTITKVADHVIAETPYASSNVKELTLAPAQKAGEIASPNQRRIGTFQDGTMISFSD